MRFVLTLLLGVIPALAQSNFYEFSVDQDRLGGAPDFSFLNHPLGPSDRLFVRDGHFYRVGPDLKPNTADDERVRLFGVNLAFGANFPAEADAARIAKRLRRLGVNMVRCHHMDTSPDRDPENANSLLTTGPYPTLNPISVGRLRRFLDALKSEGIYINLNLHVGYRFRPDVDHVPPVPGMEFPNQSKPLHIFHARMVELQTEYTRKVIEALRLRDDPVLGVVEIDNETALLEAWQRGSLDKYALGDYRAELEKQWNDFYQARHGKRAGVLPLVAVSDAAADSRTDDYLRFLTDRDRYYLKQMLAAVRDTAGRLVPVAGTQMGYGGLLNLDSHADLDYQDNHFYIDHYNFPHTAWDARDWRIRDSSSVGGGLTTFLNMAAAREAGRPYTVSEFNEPWPNRHAAEIDPTLAAFAAFQDWDSIMHFAYSHSRNWDNSVPTGFDLNSDWTKYPNAGQSAWLFRTGAIQRGKVEVRIPVTAELQLQGGRSRRGGAIAPFLNSALNYDPAVALVHRVGLTRQGGKLAEAPTAPYRSDTGELSYDPSRRVYTIAAPQAAGVFGFLGKDKVAAGAIDVQLAASAGEFATILVTALDGKQLKDSARLLISTPGYTLGSQNFIHYPGTTDWWTLDPEPGSNRPSGTRSGGKPPVRMERVESTLTLRTAAKSLEVYPLDGAGARRAALPAGAVKRVRGGFEIHLQGEGQALAPWFEAVTR